MWFLWNTLQAFWRLSVWHYPPTRTFSLRALKSSGAHAWRFLLWLCRPWATWQTPWHGTDPMYNRYKLLQLWGSMPFPMSQLAHANFQRWLHSLLVSQQPGIWPTIWAWRHSLPHAFLYLVRCASCCLCGYLSSLWNNQISPDVLNSGKF